MLQSIFYTQNNHNDNTFAMSYHIRLYYKYFVCNMQITEDRWIFRENGPLRRFLSYGVPLRKNITQKV